MTSLGTVSDRSANRSDRSTIVSDRSGFGSDRSGSRSDRGGHWEREVRARATVALTIKGAIAQLFGCGRSGIDSDRSGISSDRNGSCATATTRSGPGAKGMLYVCMKMESSG